MKLNIKPIVLFIPAILIVIAFLVYLWIGDTWIKLKRKRAIVRLMRLDEKNGMYN